MRKRLLLAAAAGLICAVMSAPVFAYTPLTRWMLFNGAYTFDGDKVNSAMNLGPGTVNAMAIDANGTVWMAVSGRGLRSWDGKKLNTPAIPKESFALNSDITSLATDSKGGIYVGTADGLARWDGSAWTNITPDVIGMSSVREIVVTPTDKVYISGVTSDGTGLSGGALAFFNGQGWNKWTSAEGSAPDTLMQNLVLDANNHLWMSLGMHNKGLAKFDGKNWKTFNTSSGLPANDVRSITTNGSKMYFATSKSLIDFDGTSWNVRPYSNGFGPKLADRIGTRGQLDVTSVLVEDNGSVWLGFRNDGVYNYRDAFSDHMYDVSNSLLPGNGVMQIVKDRDGAKWFLTGEKNEYWPAQYLDQRNSRNRNSMSSTNGAAGIAVLKEYGRINDPKWTVYEQSSFDTRHYGMPYDIAEDKSGTIWFTGDAGLVQMKDGRMKAYGYKNELQSAFNKMYIAPDGKIYVNTAITGIKVYDNGSITDFAKWPNMGGVLNMYTDAKGNFWSAGSGGLSKRVGDDWETFNKRHGDLPSVIVYTVFSDSKGRIWAGTAKGLAQYNDSVFVKVETEFPSDDIQSIAEDSKGRLWFGSNRGLSMFDGTTWTHISKVEDPKIKNPRINSISIDKNDVLWMATESDGLLRYDGTSWKQWDSKNTGTLFDHITAVKAASDGKIYVSSGPSDFELNQSEFVMGSTSGDPAIEKGLKDRIRLNGPKKVFAIITP